MNRRQFLIPTAAGALASAYGAPLLDLASVTQATAQDGLTADEAYATAKDAYIFCFITTIAPFFPKSSTPTIRRASAVSGNTGTTVSAVLRTKKPP